MAAADAHDGAMFAKKHRFFGMLFITSLIGVLLISFAIYRASQELEIVHEVDNMSRLVPALLGEDAMRRMLRGERPPPGTDLVSGDAAYRFYLLSDRRLRPLQGQGLEGELRLLAADLEATRVSERGGYFEADGQIHTWAGFKDAGSGDQLLVVHRFTSTGVGPLVDVYKQRLVIPVMFYLWLVVWVSLILNHLLAKMKAQQDQVQQMALRDPLTGLPNRSLMEDRLLKMIQASRRDKLSFALGLIDLDGFKGINDRYGHVYGDELLRQVAARLESRVRGSDTAARLGGDEFVVLMSDMDEHSWDAAFEHILSTLLDPYPLFDTQVTISASIGVSIYPAHGDELDSLLRHADKAMYSIKADGGGKRLFERKTRTRSPGETWPGGASRPA